MILRIPIRSGKYSMAIEAHSHLASRRSAFQQIDVYDTVCFGRMLTLDGHIQLTELDEHAYHEALVDLPLLSAGRFERALVVGGGDGGVIRQLCRWPFQQIDMVEIDEDVVQISKDHLPFVSSGAFDDPRVNLMIADAFPFVQATEQRYDFIVVDSTDTYEDEEGEISEMLFTEAFYRDVQRVLSPGGFVVTQADNPVFCPYSRDEILALFASVFAQTGTYQAIIPSFGSVSAFVWGSNDANLLPPSALDRQVFEGRVYRMLNPVTYSLAFADLGFNLPSTSS